MVTGTVAGSGSCVEAPHALERPHACTCHCCLVACTSTSLRWLCSHWHVMMGWEKCLLCSGGGDCEHGAAFTCQQKHARRAAVHAEHTRFASQGCPMPAASRPRAGRGEPARPLLPWLLWKDQQSSCGCSGGAAWSDHSASAAALCVAPEADSGCVGAGAASVVTRAPCTATGHDAWF